VAEREASGEFDYLIGDLAEADSSSDDDALPEPVPPEDFDYAMRDDDQWDDPDDGFWSNEAEADRTEPFDAFDSNTWHFEPAPPPWYRSKQALTALTAAAAAAVALVISAVLLVFRPGTAMDETTYVTPTAPPTTAASTELATSAAPPPPPAETSAAPIEPGPVQTYRPRNPPRTTKQPEIGVTRTPVTRSPISVAPQRPGTRD
jgi:hypothetical protein